MQNYRALNPNYKSKSTVKHPIINSSISFENIPIKSINISDLDKKGNKIKRGRKSKSPLKRNRQYVYSYIVHYDINRVSKYTKEPIKVLRYYNKPQIIGKIINEFGIKLRIISRYGDIY